jgi:serine/threonine protein phosphatase PrpC
MITENQDTIVVDKSIWIVCDGHGRNGKTVSEFVGRVLHESCTFVFC